MDEIKEKPGFDKFKSYKNIYENLSNIVIEHPELAKDVFVAFEKESNEYDRNSALEGKGIHEMSKKERQETFERSDKLRKEHPVMQEVTLTTMCRCYVAEDDEKTKLGFLKTLYQIRNGGKTNKEKREMANTFAKVLDKAPELKKDENLVALSKVDFVVSQPTRQVKKQVERS